MLNDYEAIFGKIGSFIISWLILYLMLGRLKSIEDLRVVWKNEAIDFTKWLAEPGNLELLSDEVGISIKLKDTEASVGDFNVDILAEEEDTGKIVIIENQLEATDHDHLGKLLTYASGYDAEYIIWIVKDVRDEHKKAIDWLNEHTDENINFFAIKMELWQIGDSPMAPKFQIISKPNDWAKAVKDSVSDLTDTKLMQLEFWNNFKEYCISKSSNLKLRKPRPQHWYDITYGNAESHIALTVDKDKNKMRCEIYIVDSKDLFKELHKNREAIESELGEKLEWMELPERKASRIILTKEANVKDKKHWDEYFDWLLHKAEDFKKVFIKYV